MPEERNYQTEAIIIRKTKLGEADRVLTLYTPERGKIEAVAKGVRRPKSKMAGHLELLTHSLIRLARGRNLDTIIGSQTIDSFASIKDDLWLTSYGLYAAELVNQFNALHVANQPMFRLLLETLKRLSFLENAELVLRYFEVHLLELSGYRPQLMECVACRTELKPAANAFCSSLGGVLCPECQTEHRSGFALSVDALKVLRLLQRSDFEVVRRLKLSPALGQELKNALASYIRYLLEKDLKSADFLDKLQQEIGPGTR